jgi:hypothetical protein
VNRGARTLLIAASLLVFAASAVLATGPRTEPKFSARGLQVTTTTAAPATTTTPPPPVVVTVPPTTIPKAATTAAPRPPAAPRVTAAPTTSVPVVRAPSGRAESCGWAWDATRIDDGSLNEVSIALDVPRRPNEAVTITVKPGASLTSTPAMSHGTSTDGGGQAGSTFSLSNDKRDWMLTVSAVFASGGSCAAQTFTVVY